MKEKVKNNIIKSFESEFGLNSTIYELIGCNMKIIHVVGYGDSYVEVHDILAFKSGDPDFVNMYPEARFFEEYGGFHMGTDDVSIEDLIMMEWAFLISNERSDFATTASHLKSFNKKVKVSDLELNFN